MESTLKNEILKNYYIPPKVILLSYMFGAKVSTDFHGCLSTTVVRSNYCCQITENNWALNSCENQLIREGAKVVYFACLLPDACCMRCETAHSKQKGETGKLGSFTYIGSATADNDGDDDDAVGAIFAKGLFRGCGGACN